MSSAATSAGTSMDGKFDAEPGTILRDRYKVLSLQSSSSQGPFIWLYSTFVALDTRERACVCLTFLEKAASKAITFDRLGAIADACGRAAAGAHMAVPMEIFSHEGHTCMVTELHGPQLNQLRCFGGPEDGCYPPPWIRKVAQDALTSLRFLHAEGVVHGSVDLMALVLTYPQLKKTSEQEVTEFFGFNERPPGYSVEKRRRLDVLETYLFNETGTSANPDVDMRFRLKLQNFGKAFVAGGEPRPLSSSEYIQAIVCPPPELLLKDELGPAIDIWYLGLLLADFFSAVPFFATLVGGREGTPVEKLFNSQDLLGPLPPSQAAILPPGTAIQQLEHVPNALAKNFRDTRQSMAQCSGEESLEEKEFRSSGELDAAADLVKGLLQYDPTQRLTAAQALEHDFFKRY